MTCHLMNLPKQVNPIEVQSKPNKKMSWLLNQKKMSLTLMTALRADDYLHSVKKWLQTQERKITPETNYPSVWTRS